MNSLKEALAWAEEKKLAIGHFNISDSEGFKAVVEGARFLSLGGFKVPVVIGVSEGERDFIGLKEVIALAKVARDGGLPIFVNADHTYSLERTFVAIDAGVDSVIIDFASKSFEENVLATKRVVEYAKGKSVLVEGELGFIGQSSKVLENLPEGVSEETQTKPEEAKMYVEETGIDLLAPSVGNVHGMVRGGEPKLNIERIASLKEAVSVPLVLHGASGNSNEEIGKAIEAGIRIVHINTELRLAYKEGIREGLESEEVAPYKFMAQGVLGMKEVVVKKLKLFNHLN